jgi:hypothetical protein
MNLIDQFNYWEHLKRLKELALIYPPEHPVIIKLTETINKIKP